MVETGRVAQQARPLALGYVPWFCLWLWVLVWAEFCVTADRAAGEVNRVWKPKFETDNDAPTGGGHKSSSSSQPATRTAMPCQDDSELAVLDAAGCHACVGEKASGCCSSMKNTAGSSGKNGAAAPPAESKSPLSHTESPPPSAGRAHTHNNNNDNKINSNHGERGNDSRQGTTERAGTTGETTTATSTTTTDISRGLGEAHAQPMREPPTTMGQEENLNTDGKRHTHTAQSGSSDARSRRSAKDSAPPPPPPPTPPPPHASAAPTAGLSRPTTEATAVISSSTPREQEESNHQGGENQRDCTTDDCRTRSQSQPHPQSQPPSPSYQAPQEAAIPPTPAVVPTATPTPPHPPSPRRRNNKPITPQTNSPAGLAPGVPRTGGAWVQKREMLER
ncbi:unnamed protein product, partial [Sphacelaria rigidula]